MTTLRLPPLRHGHRLRERLFMGLMRLMTGHGAPDVVRTLLYRRDFWGDRYNDVLQPVMRGASEWSVGERELFAAFVSSRNRCRF
jgi:hypothetical protein